MANRMEAAIHDYGDLKSLRDTISEKKKELKELRNKIKEEKNE